MKSLILASASPYRRQLLNRTGLEFRCIPADIDESPLSDESPAALATRLARVKAQRIAVDYPTALIIGSDQVAELNGEAMSKPGSQQRAFEQLRSASGKEMVFHTAVCLAGGDTLRTHIDRTLVRFRKLSDDQIRNYLRREHALDCAGSFKAEGLGIALFESITNTDPTALVGLPMIWLCRELLDLDYPII